MEGISHDAVGNLVEYGGVVLANYQAQGAVNVALGVALLRSGCQIDSNWLEGQNSSRLVLDDQELHVDLARWDYDFVLLSMQAVSEVCLESISCVDAGLVPVLIVRS